MIQKLIISIVSMICFASFAMNQNAPNLNTLPKEIQEYILALSLDKANIRQSIKNVQMLKAIDKSFYNAIKQRFTIERLAKLFGVTPRAIVLHSISMYKLNKQEAQKLLDKYPANKLLDQKFIDAVEAGDSEEICSLLRQNADVNAQDKNGVNALVLACKRNNKDIIELLLKYGADVNTQDYWGFTALIWAAKRRNKDIVEQLIRAGAEVNAQDKQGYTALVCATEDGYEDIKELLLKYGAVTNAQDDSLVALIIPLALYVWAVFANEYF